MSDKLTMFFIYLLVSWEFLFIESENKTLNVGVFFPFAVLDNTVPAGAYAGLQEVRRRQLLQDYQIFLKFGDTNCDPRTGMKTAVRLWSSQTSIQAVIGDGCSNVCLPLGLLTAAWNMPHVSFRCQGDIFTNKAVYPTFTRVINKYESYLEVVISVLNLFGWNRIAIVSDVAELMTTFSQKLKVVCERQGMHVKFSTLDAINQGPRIIHNRLAIQKQVVREIKQEARVVIIMMYMGNLRNFLITCSDEGMLNGDYAFIGLDSAFYPDTDMWYRPDMTDALLRHGMMAVITDGVYGEVWREFSLEVQDIVEAGMLDDIPTFRNRATGSPEIDSGFMHDAILLWAYGVNKSLENGHQPQDGVKVTSYIINSTTEGVTGSIIIDQNGDRLRPFRVMLWQNDKAIKILHYNPANKTLNKLLNPADSSDWSGVTWSGNATVPPAGVPPCGWNNEFCIKIKSHYKTYIAIVIVPILVIAVLSLLIWRYKRERFTAATRLVAWSDLEKLEPSTSRMSIMSGQYGGTFNDSLARLGHDIITIKKLGCSPVSSQTVHRELVAMRSVAHENVNAFRGLCLDGQHNAFLMLYASRGSLFDVINQKVVNITPDLQHSIIMDVAQGMRYLHASPIQYHGHLTSYNCVLDSRWICKITDYGLNGIKNLSYAGSSGDNLPAEKLLWTAPEILTARTLIVSPSADVYSYGVILQEVILQDQPYAGNVPALPAVDIIATIKSGDEDMKPVLPKGSCKEAIQMLFQRCLVWNIKERLTFKNITRKLRSIYDELTLSFVDRMIIRLEHHTQNLENIVEKRSLELQEEKCKVEMLLTELLPASIVHDIKLGRPIKPESFDEVSIFFSDIVGFTRISAAGTPMDVVKMLNLMYTMFDDISSHYDVYKVATIGDAYFVASGVPIRNEVHAREIANMAKALLDSADGFIIPHVAESLRIRVGIHSGPCVAGVVGVKTPRYLLFGDTVDIASYMESSGEAMRIHVTEQAADLIRKHSQHDLTLRGDTYLKGVGQIETYWLE